MFSTLRTRFGIPGVISVMALVFAMFGGAYAASNSSDGGKATASAKAKKGPRGPKGPKGDTGPAGPQGPAGAAGAKGDKGDTGSAGANGKSLLTGTATSGECSEGGITVEVESTPASKKKVCNGAQGIPGSPWAVDGVLPGGATETGTWGVYGLPPGAVNVPINFPIPLAQAPDVTYLDKKDETSADCPGIVAGLPTAEPGNLCVYTIAEGESFANVEVYYPDPTNFFVGGASQTGAVIRAECEPGFCYGGGAWAVTAAE